MAFFKSPYKNASLRKMTSLDSQYVTDLMEQICGFLEVFFSFIPRLEEWLDIAQLMLMNF